MLQAKQADERHTYYNDGNLEGVRQQHAPQAIGHRKRDGDHTDDDGAAAERQAQKRAADDARPHDLKPKGKGLENDGPDRVDETRPRTNSTADEFGEGEAIGHNFSDPVEDRDGDQDTDAAANGIIPGSGKAMGIGALTGGHGGGGPGPGGYQ